MAFTSISDLSNAIRPNVFASAVLEQSLAKNALITSGIIARDPAMDAALAGTGYTFPAGYIEAVVDQSGYAPNTPTDDPSDLATPKKISAGKRTVPRLERNDHFSFTDLAISITAIYIADQLAAQAASMFLNCRQSALIATIKGALNETNTPTLVNTSGAAFSQGGLLASLAAWGDQADLARTVIVMNSAAQFALRVAEPNAFIPASKTDMGMTTYWGMPILVDDTIVDAGSVRTVYFIKSGGVRYGVGTVPNPVELQREALGGNGGGASTLGFRDAFGFYVPGVSWKGTSVAENLPTDAELATASNWELVGNAKRLGVAAYTFTF